MPMQGFECNERGVSFEDMIPENPEQKIEIKCPQCGGKNVVQSKTAWGTLKVCSCDHPFTVGIGVIR